jgi:hypothetical protein
LGAKYSAGKMVRPRAVVQYLGPGTKRLFENEIKGLNGEIFCFVLGGKYCVRLTAGIKHFTFHVVFILAFNLWI